MGVVREVGDKAELEYQNRGSKMSEETKANEQNSKGKRSWLFRKITDDWIFGEVLVISAVFIIAYAVNFHGQWFSPKTEDWAYFATYLSGTVGVTAVVATLIVLVRTLGQQQALIDSQDEILKAQNAHINLTEKQLKSEDDRRKVELAYNKVLKIFPAFFGTISPYVDSYFYPNKSEEDMYDDLIDRFKLMDLKVDNFFDQPQLVYEVLAKYDMLIVYIFMERFFSRFYKIYRFMLDNASIDLDMREYFDIYLSDSIQNGRDYYFYFLCYHAYLSGGKQNDLAKAGSKYLGLPSNYEDGQEIFRVWYGIGKLVESYEED